ncbi:MAG: hypothetical protein ACLPX9_12005 [Rhodomicrobium sp.]
MADARRVQSHRRGGYKRWPVIALREGLQHTVAYFDRLLSAGSNERIAPLRGRPAA